MIWGCLFCPGICFVRGSCQVSLMNLALGICPSAILNQLANLHQKSSRVNRDRNSYLWCFLVIQGLTYPLSPVQAELISLHSSRPGGSHPYSRHYDPSGEDAAAILKRVLLNSFSLVGACGLSPLTQNTSLTTTCLTVAWMFSFAVKGKKPAAELLSQTTVRVMQLV